MPVQLVAVRADITKLEVNAVVNAANSSLLGGSGVDGAIHRAAGRELEFECRMLGGCKPGDAKVTKGHLLPAKWIIHTVGPVWRGGGEGEAEILRSCYRRSLEEAVRIEARSVAFPSISTGIYGFPIQLAAEIALSVVKGNEWELDEIVFCCFSDGDLAVYAELLSD